MNEQEQTTASAPSEVAPCANRGGSSREEVPTVEMTARAAGADGGTRYKTLMVELGTSSKLVDSQVRHDDGSVQARYSHLTAGMRRRLMESLTETWKTALEARRRMADGSPVAALDRLPRKEEGM
jgi:hypothetical protein